MRLEFALTVVVVGVIAALALGRIAELQVSAGDARAQTTSAQARSSTALTEASASLPSSSSAAPKPCSSTHRSEPRTGAATGIPSLSCP
jgi:hypothetical protein